jgi:hypothetical protein
MIKKSWFPTANRVAIVDTSATNYFHSVWVGVTAPILNLPTMVWLSIVYPMLQGILEVVLAITLSVSAGIVGMVVGVDEEQDEVKEDNK